MSKLIFKVEDFIRIGQCKSYAKENCAKAQTIYDEHISKLPKVYGNLCLDFDSKSYFGGSTEQRNLDTHTARLDCVKEIK